MTKEKDAAVATVALGKTEKARLQSEHQTTLDARQGEILSLKKRLVNMMCVSRNMNRSVKALEGKVAAHNDDVDAIVAKHEKEVEKLRAAHAKALEMLMSYQEENDLLRSAVSGIYGIFFNLCRWQICSKRRVLAHPHRKHPRVWLRTRRVNPDYPLVQRSRKHRQCYQPHHRRSL